MILAAMITTAALAGPGAPEPVPVCETVQVQEASGNGPIYYIRLCGATALPVKDLTVNGSIFPEHNTTTWRPVVFWQPQSSAGATGPSGIP